MKKNTWTYSYIGKLFFLLLITVGVGLVAFKTKDSHFSPPQITTSTIPTTYILKPINTTASTSPTAEYPHVQTAPGAFGYIFIDYLEKEHLKDKKITHLQLAGKRITEVEKWGNDIPIHTTFTTVDDLKRNWKKDQPSIWKYQSHGKFNSWETIFARYILHMEQVILSLQPLRNSDIDGYVQRLLEIEGIIQQHEGRFVQIIQNSSRTTDDKSYLQQVNTSVFAHLQGLIQSDLTDTDLFHMHYAMAPIILNKDLGIYNYSVNYGDAQLLFEQITPVFFIDKAVQSDTISINSNTEILTLQTPKINILTRDEWLHTSDIRNKIYTYSFLFSPSHYSDTHILQIQHQFTNASLLIVEDITETEKVPFVITKKILLPVKQPVPFTVVLNKQSKKLPFYKVTLRLSYPISTYDLDTFTAELYPLVQPEITLTKISPLPEQATQTIQLYKKMWGRYHLQATNTTAAQDRVIEKSGGFGWQITEKKINNARVDYEFLYRPHQLAVIGFSLLVICTLIYSYIGLYGSIRHNAVNGIVFLLKKKKVFVHTFVHLIHTQWYKYRLGIGIVTVAAILGDIFFNPRFLELPILVITCLWILVLILYRVTALASFIIAFLFLITTPLFILFRYELIGEKFAVWGFTLLIIGILHLIYEIRHTSIDKSEYHTLVYQLKNSQFLLLSKYIVPLTFRICLSLARKMNIVYFRSEHMIYRWICYIFKTHPKTLRDIVLNLLKAITLIIVTGFFLYGTVLILQKTFGLTGRAIEKYQKQRILDLAQPQIYELEPTIVYHATKVIIRGKELGSLDVEKAYIRSNRKTQPKIELWTDNKIIFTIPLEWKPGEITFRIEKPVKQDGNIIKLRSNEVQLKLLPPFNHLYCR